MFISDEAYFFNNIISSNEERLMFILQSKEKFYNSYEIPKSNGKRKIHAINNKSELCKIQRNLSMRFLNKLSLPDAPKGFIKGLSYNDFLVEHKNNKYFLKIDIKNFFDNINEKHIMEILKEYVKSDKVLIYISDICTLDNSLPQGAITSPVMSNVIFSRIDQRITKYCQRFDIVYTRYADDMLFSSNKYDFKTNPFFYRKIKFILKENNFAINVSKKKISESFLSHSGYVIKNDIHLSRKKLKGLNNILYYFKSNKNYNEPSKYKVDKNIFDKNWLKEINELKLYDSRGKSKEFKTINEFVNFLAGYRSFLISITKANDSVNSSVKQLQNKIHRIEIILDAIQQFYP